MFDCPYPPVRRVITGHTTNDAKSIFLKDEVQQAMAWPGSKDQGYGIHATETIPASNDSELTTGSFVDTIATFQGICQPAGSVFRVFELAPGSISKYHRSHSLDYLIVAEGSVTIELDDGKTTLLKKGDVLCQRGTAHAWKNESSEWVRLYVVMLGANPIRVNGEDLTESFDIKSE